MAEFSSSDNELIIACIIDRSVDQSCSCLLSGGGPQLNTDIGGPGVRISFYVQAIFLALLSTLSNKDDDIANSLYTLVVTNIAMVVASFILGFLRDPQMSLHDALIVIYLLFNSWTATLLSTPPSSRKKKIEGAFGYVYVAQSYFIFAFVLAVLIKADTFGSTEACNSHAVMFIFGSFPMLNAGRIVALVILAIVFLIFTLLTIFDYDLWKRSRYSALGCWLAKKMGKDKEPEEVMEEIETDGVRRDRQETKYWDPETGLFTHMDAGARRQEELTRPFVMKGRHMLQLLLLTIFWAISVANTEKLIVKNRFDGGGDGNGPRLWGFGQILPMFLILLPLMNLIKLFIDLYRFRGRNPKKIHTTRIEVKTMVPHTRDAGPNRYTPPFGGRRSPRQRHRGTFHSQFSAMFSPHLAGMDEVHVRGRQPSARISDHSIRSRGDLEVLPQGHSTSTLRSVTSFVTAQMEGD